MQQVYLIKQTYSYLLNLFDSKIIIYKINWWVGGDSKCSLLRSENIWESSQKMQSH